MPTVFGGIRVSGGYLSQGPLLLWDWVGAGPLTLWNLL